MGDLARALPHLIMALGVIAAVSVLAAMHILTGGEALPVIAAAGGFTLGGTVGSASASATARATGGAGVSPPALTRPAGPASPSPTPANDATDPRSEP